MTNLEPFFTEVAGALYKGSLPDWQRTPLLRLIEAGVSRHRLLEELAYVLATAHHETARFRTMEEVGKGEKHLYGEQIAIFSNKKAAFYGRGFIQITWVGNYARMSVILGVDFVNNPELAADPKHAADIMWEGMIRGLFTGKSLADYISEGSVDYKGARRIVNGTDKDDLIAEYAAIFEKALRSVKGDQIAEPVCNRMGCPMKGIK